MVYMNQHDIKLFTENVCILRNSSKFLRPLSLSMCILQDIKNRYFMHLNIYQSPSGVRVHESISTWFYLEMADSWDEIFWWEPLPWDHTREISNTNSCINDINELLFYKKKKKKIGSKSIHYNTFSLNLPHFSELPYNSHFLIYHDVWKKNHWNIV